MMAQSCRRREGSMISKAPPRGRERSQFCRACALYQMAVPSAPASRPGLDVVTDLG